ncbi:hypothetical protein PRNP1_009667 [Phytophthora ramorum]
MTQVSAIKAKTARTPAQRKSRRKFDFPLQTLIAYSCYRQDDAAKRLGVASITLKRICRRHNYRWGYRSIKAKLRRKDVALHKLQASKTFHATTPKLFPSSPVVATSEILLQLHQGKSVTSSPTSVSGLSSPISPRYPKLPRKSGLEPQLPPLALVLQWHKLQSIHDKTPLRPMLHRPVDYKSSAYAAAFNNSAPTFPSARMAPLIKTCEAAQRLLPSADSLLDRYSIDPFKNDD